MSCPEISLQIQAYYFFQFLIFYFLLPLFMGSIVDMPLRATGRCKDSAIYPDPIFRGMGIASAA